MRKPYVVILAALLVLVSLRAFADGDTRPPAKVIAYYFHGAFRCATCTKMERYAREAIQENFKEALDSGRLEFRAVDVEEKGNEHYAKEYQLYTKALILSLVKDGKEVGSKNLDKIWEYVRDERRFKGYVAEQVKLFLGEIE